jgi:hypothetical protein
VHDLEDPMLAGPSAYVQHVFDEDGRLHVGGGDGLTLVLDSMLDHRLGRHLVVMGVVGPRLGDLPILTELAVEIAPCRGEGEGAAGRKDVEERLFLHGVHMKGAGVAIDE